jgi:Mce-associated membrane protein
MADNADTADAIESEAHEDLTADHSRRPPTKLAAGLGLIMCVAMGGLVGWLGVQAYRYHQQDGQRATLVQAARQGAIDLTTIDYTHADADVQRILDSATGTFYDDFAKRSQPFIDVVKQAKSTTHGTVTEAGLQSIDHDTAQVLVAVAVTTSNAGAQEQQPRAWRMRISVQQLGDTAKVSNVEFVP